MQGLAPGRRTSVRGKKFLKFFQKTLDILTALCYTYIVERERNPNGEAPRGGEKKEALKKNKKKFQKTLDKPNKMCYNKGTR